MRRRGRAAPVGAQGREGRAARVGRRGRTGRATGPGRRAIRTRSPRRLQRPVVSDDPSRLGPLRGGGRVPGPEKRIVDGERLLATRRKAQRQKRRGDAYAPPQQPCFEHGSSPKRRAENNLSDAAIPPSPHAAGTTKYLTSVHCSYRARHIVPRTLLDSPVAAVPGLAVGSDGIDSSLQVFLVGSRSLYR